MKQKNKTTALMLWCPWIN